MFKTCALILPALIPSWRFFETVEASPRIEWTLLATAREEPTHWRSFRPRPETIPPFHMLGRLLWNPSGNEALYMVSCAERIALTACSHSIREITSRILDDIAQLPLNTCFKLMQFRLIFVSRDASGPTRETVFVSTPVPTLR